jgi:chloride channel protein, CIC family
MLLDGPPFVRPPKRRTRATPRVAWLTVQATAIGLAAAVVAAALTRLIGLVTNLCFFGRASTDFVQPGADVLGPAVVAVPILGGLVVGLLARFGAEGIRGHGIPEAMERVLVGRSRISPRLLVLKPLSAAIAIGTGGPFGAEGPIIATGGALGSLVGQVLHVTAAERKTLLAAGAAGGMAATFGSPVSAVLLAVELLLFEYRPASLVPVAFAAVAATGVRLAIVGPGPAFVVPELATPTGAALVAYVVLGAIVGLVAVAITRAVYALEDGFARLPIHWMWWPAIGGLAVGVVGWLVPQTLGVGYANIEQLIAGASPVGAGRLAAAKLASWTIALASGTSGGTLAPLFTIGAGLGATIGGLAGTLLPSAGIDPRMAALVAMAAMFTGASRALLASVVFAFEATRQPIGLLPLLGGCAAAYLVSWAVAPHSIMTEKIARRGRRVPFEYASDFLDFQLVRDWASRAVVTVAADATLAATRAWIASGAGDTTHQGFPVVDPAGRLVGVVTRRDLLDPAVPDARRVRDVVKRPPAVVFDDHSLREAADHMVRENVGRLPVVTRAAPRTVVGMITRSDLLAAHAHRLDEHDRVEAARFRPRRRALRVVGG